MIILSFAIIPKQPDPYYQVDITRKDLVILQEKKQQNNSRNIIIIITLPPSPLLMPKPLDSEIPAKYLDHKLKALDPPNLTELETNT
jgi:hypothetical protein